MNCPVQWEQSAVLRTTKGVCLLRSTSHKLRKCSSDNAYCHTQYCIQYRDFEGILMHNSFKKKDKERLDLAIAPVNQQECLLKSPSQASRLTASANQDSTQTLQNRRCPAIQSFAHLSADSCGWCLMQEQDMIVSHDFRLFKIFEMFEGAWTLLKQKQTYTV